MLKESRDCLTVRLDDIEKLGGHLNRIQFVEIRLDLGFSTKNLEKAKKIITLLRERGLEVIATCRRAEDKGDFTGSETERLALLKWAVEHGATIMDLEFNSEAESLLKYKNQECRKILSYHNFKRIPDDIESIAEKMVSKRAWLCKIVCNVTRYNDNTRLLDLNRYFSSLDQDSTCFGLGEKCVYSRVFLITCDGKMNFYGLPKKMTAPGQLTISDRELYRMDSIDKQTECFGIIGNPVSHSLSPSIHNTLFGIYGLNSVFLPFPVDDIEEFMEFARHNGINGLAVTYPWKDERFFLNMARIEENAKKFSSGNTLFAKNGEFVMTDTDYNGFAEFFENRIQRKSGSAVIIGTGNTGEKIAHYLREKGWIITLISRKPEDRRKALGAQYMVEDYSLLASVECDLLINTTPLGALSGDDWRNLFIKKTQTDMIVMDINYGQNTGPFLSCGMFNNNIKFDGMEMLVNQAIMQFQMWTGINVEAKSRRLLYQKLNLLNNRL
jgi:3-dehydroquinate dehydratase/shikimate dehydrogenase